MTQIDTSTEGAEKVAQILEKGGTIFAQVAAARRLRALAAERDTATRQAEDCARVCAEQAEEIQRLQARLAEARNAAEGVINEAVGMADDEGEKQYVEKRLRAALDATSAPAPHETEPREEFDLKFMSIPIWNSIIFDVMRGSDTIYSAPQEQTTGGDTPHPAPHCEVCEDSGSVSIADVDHNGDHIEMACSECNTPRVSVQEAAEVLEQCKKALLDNYRYGMGVMLTAHHIPAEQFVATTKPTLQEAAKVLLDARNPDGLTVLPDYVRDMLRALTQEGQTDAS